MKEYAIFNYIVLGDSGVGKTSLLSQFMVEKFDPSAQITIGVMMESKVIMVDNKKIKLRIFDTAGQERYRSLTSSYYRNAAGALLVYDITRIETFYHVERWLEEARYQNANMSIMLIGNKLDLPFRKRVVSMNEGENFAKEHGLKFLEASAKTAQNVEEAFITLATTIYQKCLNEVSDLSIVPYGIKIRAQEKPPSRFSKCCS